MARLSPGRRPLPPSDSQALERALTLLALVVSPGGQRDFAAAAREAGLPLSTSYRMLATLRRRGFVARAGRGEYLPGMALLRLGRAVDLHGLLGGLGRPVLSALARRTGLTAHLGVFENEMVTYLVKASGRAAVLTREGMQLEAYCSGIGKVLLAALPPTDAERYLSSGPFVRLTPHTVVEPGDLRAVLAATRAAGFAVDDREIDEALRCIAVPVRGDDGRVCAAISLASPVEASGQAPVEANLTLLKAAARRIEAALAFGGDA